MTANTKSQSAAWYCDTREQFLKTPKNRIADQLAGRAAAEDLAIESAQAEEWQQSVEVLQKSLDERIPILREALQTPAGKKIHHVILEFDFRRRGLRIDCLLLADGVLFVVEFKRTDIQRADRDQVMTYSVNLLEFHKATRDWCEREKAIVVPILTLTQGQLDLAPEWLGLSIHSWPSLTSKPLECDRDSLATALMLGLANRRTSHAVSAYDWLNSPFSPSSSILDATISLYGNHDVVAISEHAAPKAEIDASVAEIREVINWALTRGEYHIVFLSGAPGAGKTLVGLEIVMRGKHADSAVFVTGNAPLVDVLNKALENSYRAQGNRSSTWTPTGYHRKDAHLVSAAATFKVVKAHNFLGERGTTHQQEDGRVLVFDEAQRTYEKGRRVLGHALEDHEADLILQAQRKSFSQGGAVVVALIGHNQAINRGERGMIAWLDAAERFGWTFSISDETLSLTELEEKERWSSHVLRRPLSHGHLHQSMRYYRNTVLENWVSCVLDNDFNGAQKLMVTMTAHGNSIWLTRDLQRAKAWVRGQAIGGQRAGLIASGQAKRLAAEGLFVELKPDIANWMLTASTDVRSSNALETVQNQYQVQGLELDYCIVCWDADLRRQDTEWKSFKMSGSDWQSDNLLDVAKNGYRVLLTRSRKGMVVFVPKGDASGNDRTRAPAFYDQTFEYLKACGAKEMDT